ncbi:GWxTD domain-containing protein [bacterium]|nr:GWxTD domain-containing protein [bacterium]
MRLSVSTLKMSLLLAIALAAGAVWAAGGPPPSQQAAALFAAGDSAGAGQLLERVLERDRKDYPGYVLRGQFRLKHRDWNRAQSDFRHALSSPDPTVRSQAYRGLGDVIRYGSEGHLTQALDQYRLAVLADSTNREALYSLAEAGFDLADSKGYDLSSSALTRLVCLDPEYRGALGLWNDRFVRHPEDQTHRVCENLEGWAGADSLYGGYWLHAGRLRFRLGDCDSALADLERAGREAPAFKPAERQLLRGRCRLALGDSLAFEALYDSALAAAAADGDYTALLVEAQGLFTPEEAAKWERMSTAQEMNAFFRTLWARRDPDPLTPYNERRVTHYVRLAEAQSYFALSNPHSKFQNSESYNRLVSQTLPQPGTFRLGDRDSGPYGVDPKLMFQRGRGLDLDQRGLLFLRHGPPDEVRRPEAPTNKPLASLLDEHEAMLQDLQPVTFSAKQFGDPVPDGLPSQEVWRYGSVFFPFEKVYGAGDFIYIPVYLNSIGRIEQALECESFEDPLPACKQDFLGVDFRGPQGRVELLFFQSLPQDSVRTENAPFADLALFDTTWTVVARDSCLAWSVKAGPEYLWLALSRALLPPGNYNLALRLDVPGRRTVHRQAFSFHPYTAGAFELSGVVLGTAPGHGHGLFSRNGVEIDPRPSLSFTVGEKVAVYLELYNLEPDSAGQHQFQERVTVARDEQKSELARLLGFASGKRETSLSMTFERGPSAAALCTPESFDIDTAPLLPGVYSLNLELLDRVSGLRRTRKCAFEVKETGGGK